MCSLCEYDALPGEQAVDRTSLSALFAAIALFHTSCATVPDGNAKPVGDLSGDLILAWDNSDERFIFIPSSNRPLVYRRPGKPDIRPARMYTDGGSIPRIFWSQKGLSPWAYGPAYVIHDFLYNEHRCHVARNPRPSSGGAAFPYSISEADAILYDAMLVIEQRVREAAAQGKLPPGTAADFVGGDSRALVKLAVDKFGEKAWNDVGDGACLPEPKTHFRVETIKVVEDEAVISSAQRGMRTVKRVSRVRVKNRIVEVQPTTLLKFSF
jgi:hypothetical protein